ncbi:MAG TPA: cyclase family protein [Thermomicrobiales bacterium]|nr:cyclase family protein [Thermomicrobiales bacterium]
MSAPEPTPPPASAPAADPGAMLLDALRLPRQGRIVELGTTLGSQMPQGPRETFGGFRLTPYRTPRCLAGAEPPGFDFSMELITGSPHVGTHFDGLAHIQSFGRTHGGHAARDVFDDFGWRANGLEGAAPVVCRGVLLDVVAAQGVPCLPDGFEITPDDLRRTLDLQATDVRPGDAVLVRTGWFAAHYERDPDAYFASEPGVGADAAIWLCERGMRLLGSDTSGTEVTPMPDLSRTTHVAMLVDRGVHLIEIMDLEEIARERMYEFLFVALPLRIVGGTGSWLRPIAIV